MPLEAASTHDRPGFEDRAQALQACRRARLRRVGFFSLLALPRRERHFIAVLARGYAWLVYHTRMPRYATFRTFRTALARFSALCCSGLSLTAASPGLESTWPREYSVRRDDAAGVLSLSTPYYEVQHDLRRGGAIRVIRLTHGQATNLLVEPIVARIQDEAGACWTDLNDPAPQVTHRREAGRDWVTVECRLKDDQGRGTRVSLKTVFAYRWGCVKVRREFTVAGDPVRVRDLCPLSTVLSPTLSEYGYREGLSEPEGAAPFAFGSNRWGKLRRDHESDPAVKTGFVPRSMLFANPGVEGLEWFVGSDLAPWELSLGGRRGLGRCVLEPSRAPAGLALSVSPFYNATNAATLPAVTVLEFYLGVPLLEGHALRPWLHTSFNRNRGEWVSAEQIQAWSVDGIQTVHCHNDGDYYDDGLFWRDGSYPPYPDMDRFDRVIAGCHRAGIRTATYFSNKELHPSTREFKQHGREWGRMNLNGALQHNIFRGTNEFGVQMCLRSGWLGFLKSSIDRVLEHHQLDGVYYDWNVALYCCNPLHEGKPASATAAGHWDIDELLDLMEWTRQRVGPKGLVIVHNTTTPMFSLENFADAVVANEWGYGTWKADGPALADLPLEWSLVGARARGVISYGQLNAQSPPRLHRLFALQAFLSGVTPWPASREAFELASLLKPLGDAHSWDFADWRNQIVRLDGDRCAAAVYSRPGEAYVLLGNLANQAQTVRCVLDLRKLPHPLSSPTGAILVGATGTPSAGSAAKPLNLDLSALLNAGVELTIPADSAILVHLR